MWAAYRDVPSLAVMSMLRQNKLSAVKKEESAQPKGCCAVHPAETRPAPAEGRGRQLPGIHRTEEARAGFGLFMLLSVLFMVLGFSAALTGVRVLGARAGLAMSLAELSLRRDLTLRLWGLGMLCLGAGCWHVSGQTDRESGRVRETWPKSTGEKTWSSRSPCSRKARAVT